MIRFAKFCVVGWSGTVVHFAVLYGLTEYLGLFYAASATIAVIVAATNNYVWNHKWTFRDVRDKNANVFVGWLKYLISVGPTEFVYLGLLVLFTEVFGLWYMLSAGIAIAVTSVLRYTAVAKWIWKVDIFKRKETRNEQEEIHRIRTLHSQG